MKSSQIPTKIVVLLAILAIGTGYLAWVHADTQRTPRREYEISVPAYQSDMARMVAAYERLSDQYLSLVQQHLAMMEGNDRMILQKLETLEKKLDELSKKVDHLTPPKPAQPQQPQ